MGRTARHLVGHGSLGLEVTWRHASHGCDWSVSWRWAFVQRTGPAQDLPFGLAFEVEAVAGEEDATLVLELDLFQEEDWVVSTHSTDSMFGKVDVRFWICICSCRRGS